MFTFFFILYCIVSVIFMLYWLLRKNDVFFRYNVGINDAATFISLIFAPLIFPFLIVGFTVPLVLKQLLRLKPIEEKITHFIKTGRIK